LGIDVIAEYECRHGFLRSLAKCLSLLGSVNAREANLVLLVVSIQDRDRIAVRYADHSSRKRIAPCKIGYDPQGNRQEKKL